MRGVFLGRTKHDYIRHDGPEHVMASRRRGPVKASAWLFQRFCLGPIAPSFTISRARIGSLHSGWRSTFSHCLLFDPTNAESAKYNPLLEVRKGQNEVRDVQNIADILVDPEGMLERRNHWEKTAHSLLVGAILHVLYAQSR